ncbi:HAAS domain-containing protein [Mesobacillus maritimus]|uniref:HAAS domain-containing protein n=1 Tax=Mesobacillus maritimus TaxID=1643336 RepID=UPI00384D9D66
MMLSVKSEAFIDNLRMYLMMSGKNEREIKELIEELKDHLVEVEKSGRKIEDIIDLTPEQYMASLKKEMRTDYKHLFKLLPIFFLGVIAYFLMGPAIRGEFALNIIQVIGFPIIAMFGLIIYVSFLQKAGRKQYSNKKFFIGGMIASSIVTVTTVLLLVVSSILVDPFFIGDWITDLIVILICCCIFVTTAVWSKTWFPIWLPAILFIPDVVSRFSDWSVERILIVQLASFVLMFVVLFLNLWREERRKKAKIIPK